MFVREFSRNFPQIIDVFLICDPNDFVWERLPALHFGAFFFFTWIDSTQFNYIFLAGKRIKYNIISKCRCQERWTSNACRHTCTKYVLLGMNYSRTSWKDFLGRCKKILLLNRHRILNKKGLYYYQQIKKLDKPHTSIHILSKLDHKIQFS
jgi:hypothetical protein